MSSTRLQKQKQRALERQRIKEESERQKPASDKESILLSKTTINSLREISGESFDDGIAKLIAYAKGQRSRQGLFITDGALLAHRKYVPPSSANT
jgi:hypothetical protein